jgi:RecA/RadA recombinase
MAKKLKPKTVLKEFEESVKPRTRKKDKVDPDMLIPSGSTTLNLECSGTSEGAFLLGKIVNLIGDSHAGKTLLALTMFAECSVLNRFDNHRLIYDDVESANEFDMAHLFGQSVEDRVDTSIRSHTIEDFNDNIARCIEGEQPFIYVLDSFDALTSEAFVKKDSENRKKREKGSQITGSYGDGKAKIASDFFKNRNQDLDDHKSAIIVISQTRDNIGFGAMFTPKVRSGGKALKFYSFHEIWLACQKKEKDGKRTIITNVQAKVTKNKLIGRHGEAYFPVLFDYGIDDLTSCIKFLVEEGNWSGTKSAINTKGFAPDELLNDKGMVTFKKLIQYIEKNNLEDEICLLCKEAYDKIMESLTPDRKRKY